MQNILFSLIVATYKRKEELFRFLSSLDNQLCKDVEIIIVDQNAVGFLDDILQPFKTTLNITHCYSELGVSRARNVGLQHITGEIVAFPDDDCIYPPNLLESVKKIFQNNSNAQALLTTRQDFTLGSNQPHITDLHITLIPSKYKAFHNSETFLQFYKKECVVQIGNFDENLGPGANTPYGCGEDTDYVLRAFALGFNFYRAPGLMVGHPSVNMHISAQHEKARAYSLGRIYLLHKHQMPWWFFVANILFPLYRVPLDMYPILKYRWIMFFTRLKATISLLKKYR